jgi:all-trans-retinol 13,14-reductase
MEFGESMQKVFAALILALSLSFSLQHGWCAQPPVYDVVVIGAGGGGLAAAARLSRAGMKVLVIEQNSKVGGYMGSFTRGPYFFEISLHGMDGLNPDGLHEQTFEALGIIDKVVPLQLDPMYRAVFPDFAIDVPADPDAYMQLLQQQFPHEAEGIFDLFQTMNSLYNGMQFFVHLYEGSWLEALPHYNAADIEKLSRYQNVPLSDMLQEYIADEQLIAAFTQLASYGGLPPDALSAQFFTLFWNSFHRGGFYYFAGGSQSVAAALAEVVEEHGGRIMLSTKAEKIVIKRGRAAAVQTASGQKFPCRFVVSNANAPATFNALVGRENLPEDFLKKLDALQAGTSWFQVYLGVDHDYRDAFPSGTHEIIVNGSYDQAENFSYFLSGNIDRAPYFIMNYSAVDTGAAPAGKNVIVLSTILPYDFENNWHTAGMPADAVTAATSNMSPACAGCEQYVALKQQMAEKLIQRAEALLPGLSAHIDVLEVGSPRTMEFFTSNPGGAMLGWSNTAEQVLFNRLPQATPIRNLYLAGAWTFPGGGQSAVLESGKFAAEKILRKSFLH